jgi:hypothetical protein
MEATDDDGTDVRTRYRRRFLPSETREVRLYGLRGDDMFVIEGDRADIVLRIVGGAGTDVVHHRGRGRRISVYDDPGTTTAGTGPVRLALADGALGTVRYDPLNTPEITLERALLHVGAGGLYPTGTAGYGELEGVIVGVGVRYVRTGFRNRTTAEHALQVGIAGTYDASVPALLGREWTGFASLAAASPNFAFYFHGLGNETPRDRSDAFYQVQRAYGRLHLGVAHAVADRVVLRAGPLLTFTDASRPPSAEQTVASPAAGLPERDFDAQGHAGAQIAFAFSTVDRPANPRQGWRWTAEAAGLAAAGGSASAYATVGSEVAAFVPVRLDPQFTVAARAGVRHRIGTFPFYDAATLGRFELRGLLLNRYAGRTATYQTLEARAKVYRFASYLLVADVGVQAFVDNGRVWADGESSSTWHQTYGGGLWLGLLDRVVLSGAAAVGGDGVQFVAGVGFHF